MIPAKAPGLDSVVASLTPSKVTRVETLASFKRASYAADSRDVMLAY